MEATECYSSDEGHGRKLETPGRVSRAATRSGSRQRTSRPCRSRTPVRCCRQGSRNPQEQLREELRSLQEQLREERRSQQEQFRDREGRRCQQEQLREERHSEQDQQHWERRSRSKQRRDLRKEQRSSPEQHRRLREERFSRPEQHGDQRRSRGAEQNSVCPKDAYFPQKRSRSPSFSKNDVMDILKCLKAGFPSQAQTETTRCVTKVDHKNILPDFDPSSKNQRIDVWLKKVNECASVYGWDDKTTTHFAMQKLQGLAKTWYEGLNSILFTWQEWKEKLTLAFPYEQNYGQILEDMLNRKKRFNESVESYYYEKLALLNQCDITGKRAVDCIIHGIHDRTLKSGALALRCNEPDQLLQYLVSSKDSHQMVTERTFNKGRVVSNNNLSTNSNNISRTNARIGPIDCYNCKEKGHTHAYCPKPLIKCTRCNRVGHTAEHCSFRVNNGTVNPTSTNTMQKTMCIGLDIGRNECSPTSKFNKDVTINGHKSKAFVDFGSDVTLIKRSVVQDLGLTYNGVQTLIKGFGNSIVRSIGELTLNIIIDGVSAEVICKIVDDELLSMPMLVGQSYTEQPHIIVCKDANKLQFIDLGKEVPSLQSLDIDDRPLVVKTNAVIKLHGAASIRALINTPKEGNIFLKSIVIGKPNEECLVCGGMYNFKNGFINILLVPLSSLCNFSKNSVLGRGQNVDFVKIIMNESMMVTDSHVDVFDEGKIRTGNNISVKDKNLLLRLLRKYKHCFATSLKELGCTKVTDMKIEMNSNRPIVYRPYRMSHHEREKVRGMVSEMLEADIIRESSSDYASPILLVRKKDGTHRMCIDYRMLNSVTIKERYPMPIIEDEIARLHGQVYFVTLDLASGYYQVPIREESKHLTSFVTPDGQYEFNRMPFGLANAPAVFQRMMNSVLGSARFNKATAYIDDVLIFGRTSEECLRHLEEVLQLIEKANLTLNLEKCKFLCDKIDYLGYEIGSSGVRPGEKKIECVQKFPRPQNVHNVRQFLGLASYFRKFAKNFAQISYPLSKLLKKDTAWEWGESQQIAFETLKAKLVERPILAIYDPNAEIELHTDASRIGVGGILLQQLANQAELHPVAYYSRQTSPEERNFHSFELETLAVVSSLQKFRVYLLGKEFKIVTDCSALRSTFSKRDLIPRIARWWLMLQEFNCKVEYRPGVKMSHVDALSRNPVVQPISVDDLPDQFPSVMSITSEDWLLTLQLGDPEVCRIRNILSSNIDEKGLTYIKDNYILKDNKLFRYLHGDKKNCRWVVPKGARWQICRINHDDIGHFGMEKTLDRIKRTYWFAKMSRFVKKYVSACIECAYAKDSSKSREGLLHPIPKVGIPFHTLHLDHLGPFVKSNKGFTHLLIVVDSFTKFCFLRPVRNTNCQNVIRVLEDIFSTFRIPNRLISDRGSCFTSHKFGQFCANKGIKHVLNAVASPRSNGQVERYNRTILDSLKTLNLKHSEKDWDCQLGKIQWGLNNTIQKTTGRMPSEVLFGACMTSEANPILNEIPKQSIPDDRCTIHSQVKSRIDQEQIKQKQHYDKDRKPAREYKEGELVKITKTGFNNDGQSKKLLPSFVGPYRISKVLGNDRYAVAPIPGIHSTQNKRATVVASDRIRPWIHVAALEINKDDSESENSSTEIDEEF